MNLYLVPIEYGYGGGRSLLVLADSIQEAREKAETKKTDDNCALIIDETDFGNIIHFKEAVIGYYE